MTGSADIARWVALGLLLLIVLLLLYFVARRLLETWLVHRVERQARRVESIIARHRAERFENLDRLLFQLGEIADVEAIESVLEAELDDSGARQRSQLEKLYQALGITQRYMDQLRRSPRWTERTRAAHALGRLGVAEAVPALVEVLRDPHEDARSVKLAAAQALGRMRADEAVPLLIDELETVNEWASPRIADVLASIGSAAVPMLLEAVGNSERGNARVWAAQILGRIGETRVVPSMLRYLRDRHEQVRMSVAESLGRLGDQRAINDLIRVALRDPVAPVRAEAARALGVIGDARVIENLVELLGDPDYWTRLRAIEAIEAVNPREVSFLEAALRDPTDEVRHRAAVALERVGMLEQRIKELASSNRDTAQAALEKVVEMGRAGLLDSIIAYLEHGDFRVRARVAQALGEVGERRAVDALVPLLDDEQWPVRARAVEALGKLRPAEGVQLLLPALADAEETVRAIAVAAVQRLGPPADRRSLGRVLERYDTANAVVRAAVVEAVGHLVDRRVETLLEGALIDPFPAVRLQATEALGRRAEERWIEALVDRLSDTDAQVRAAAAKALGDIGTPDALGWLARHLDTPDRHFREALTSALAHHGLDRLTELAEAPDPTLERLLAIVWSLGKIAGAHSVPHLIRLAEHPEFLVRAAVAGALAKHVNQPSVNAVLLRLMSDRNERVRAAAVNGLARTEAPELAEHLVRGLDDPDAFVRNRIALALGRVGGTDALQGLQQALQRANESAARATVIIGFALLGEDEGLETALQLLDEPGMQEEVEGLVAAEDTAIQNRFRQTLSLGLGQTAEDGPTLSRQALTRHYVDVLRNHQRPEARAAAVGALRALGDELPAELLVDTVRTDPDPDVRRLAIRALAAEAQPHERLADLYAKALRDPNAGVQTEAARGLARFGDPRFNDLLLNCFPSGYPELVRAAVDALVAANAENLLDFADTLIGHTNVEIQRGGARVLGQIGDPRAAGLLRAWLTARDAGLRAEAATALGRIGTAEAKEALIECLSDPSERVRLAALDTFAQRHGGDIVEVVAPLQSDPSVAVRIGLARLIGRVRDPAWVELGAALSQDPQERVRLEALISLLLLGDVGAARRFVELMADQPPPIVEALGDLQSEHEAVVRTRELVTSSRRPEARVAGLEALDRLGHRPLDLLLSCLGDPAADVRIAAVQALGFVDDARIDEAFESLLKDPEPRVRNAVRRQRLTLLDGTEEG